MHDFRLQLDLNRTPTPEEARWLEEMSARLRLEVERQMQHFRVYGCTAIDGVLQPPQNPQLA